MEWFEFGLFGEDFRRNDGELEINLDFDFDGVCRIVYVHVNYLTCW